MPLNPNVKTDASLPARALKKVVDVALSTARIATALGFPTLKDWNVVNKPGGRAVPQFGADGMVELQSCRYVRAHSETHFQLLNRE
jgi:hypothetical protein